MLIGACGDTECVGDCRECEMIELWDEKNDKIEFQPLNSEKITFGEILGFWG